MSGSRPIAPAAGDRVTAEANPQVTPPPGGRGAGQRRGQHRGRRQPVEDAQVPRRRQRLVQRARSGCRARRTRQPRGARDLQPRRPQPGALRRVHGDRGHARRPGASMTDRITSSAGRHWRNTPMGRQSAAAGVSIAGRTSRDDSPRVELDARGAQEAHEVQRRAARLRCRARAAPAAARAPRTTARRASRSRRAAAAAGAEGRPADRTPRRARGCSPAPARSSGARLPPVARSTTSPPSFSRRKRSAMSGMRGEPRRSVARKRPSKMRANSRGARVTAHEARRNFVYNFLPMLRFLTAGESHGRTLVVILEGLPAGLAIDVDAIARDLRRRQGGYGRGRRMAIESDRAEIVSGVRAGETLGGPVAMLIENRDWTNWQYTMRATAEFVAPRNRTPIRRRRAARPGHAAAPRPRRPRGRRQVRARRPARHPRARQRARDRGARRRRRPRAAAARPRRRPHLQPRLHARQHHACRIASASTSRRPARCPTMRRCGAWIRSSSRR